MRCSRCHEVAFQQVALCPRCGHALSRDGEQDQAAHVALSRSENEALGPPRDLSAAQDLVGLPGDYAFRTAEHLASAPDSSSRSRRMPPAPADRPSSPLFPLGARAAASRPLSVRRQTPEVPKFRVPTAREAVLPLDAPGLDDGTALQSPAVNAAARQLGRRFLAGLLDTTLLLGVNAAVVYFTMRLAGLSLDSVAQLPVIPLVTFLLFFDAAYAVALTALGGQTIGKMAVGLRVERTDGSPVTAVRALIRTGAYAISALPLGLGFAGILSRSGRGLHDCLADTRVVKL